MVQIVLTITKKSHEEYYALKTSDNSYKIQEFFSSKNSTYNFIITDKKNNSYILSLNKNYHKQKNIIKDILYFKEKDLTCIYPIFKKNFTSNLYCRYKNNQVSPSYLNQKNVKSIQKIMSQLKKLGYKSNLKFQEPTSSSYKNIVVYKQNLLPNYYFTMWNYKGLYLLSQEKLSNIKLLSKDKYENKLSILLNNFYIYFDTNEKPYSALYIYDLFKSQKKQLKLKKISLSSNIYFNGLYNNLLYITDLDNKKEYALNPNQRKLSEVGEDGNYFTFTNAKLKYLDKYNFFKDNIYFNNEVTNKNINEKYHPQTIIKQEDYYYFISQNKLYKSLNKEPTKAITLLELPKIKEWKIKEHDIILVSDDTLYFYNDNYGLLKIAKSNELKYNYKNICDFVKK